jgi:Fe-S-cluster containining protein
MDFKCPSNVHFECSKCGLCCGDTKEKPRRILLLETEVEEISNKTGLPKHEFINQITGKTPYIYEMKKSNEGKCCFLKDNQCSIYGLRPLICRFYPFELKFNVDKDLHIFDFTFECPGISKGKMLARKDFEVLFLLAKEKLP